MKARTPSTNQKAARRLVDILAAHILDAVGVWLLEGHATSCSSIATPAGAADRDPIARFVRDCLEHEPGQTVGAREMYIAYCAHCSANAARPIYETRFGLLMKRRLRHDDSQRKRVYLDVAMHDVPLAAAVATESRPICKRRVVRRKTIRRKRLRVSQK